MPWRLLIVEDDEDIRETLRDVFDARGFEVHCAGNGRAAIDLVEQTGLRPDAVLLDLLMPVMDGLEFLVLRTENPLLRAVPIIAMTAQRNVLSRSSARVYAILEKPIPLQKVIETVERACHGGPPDGHS